MVVKKIENGLQIRRRQDELLEDDSYIIEMMVVILTNLYYEVNKRGCTRLSMICDVINVILGVECIGKGEYRWMFNGDDQYMKHFLYAQSYVRFSLELTQISKNKGF